MNEALVSVVLPIYNVEMYLERCIESIVNQTYKNLEIILVDDGSPDHCPQICDEWGKKDSRVRVVHKVNAGLGMARNTGIEHATGKYICFFDSDDYVKTDTIEKIVGLAEKVNADIVTFGYSNVDNNGLVKNEYVPSTVKEIFRGKEVQEEFLPDMLAERKESVNKRLHMSAWASLYSMKLIKESGWKFVSEREIIAEDVYSLLVLYKSVQCVAVLSEALYFYCDNGASLTHTYRKDRYKKIEKFYIETTQKAKQLGYSEKVIDRVRMPYYSFTIAALKMISRANCSYREKRHYINEIMDSETFRTLINEMDYAEESFSRKVLWMMMKFKLTDICYVLLRLK